MRHEGGVRGAHEREVVAREEGGQRCDGGEAQRLRGRGERGGDVGLGGGEERREQVGGQRGERGDGGGGDVGVREGEVGAEGGEEERVEEVGRERERAEEVEREALADGGGGRRQDLGGGGAGERGDVAPRGALLQGLQQRGGLPERVRGAEVGVDLRDEEVHRAPEAEGLRRSPELGAGGSGLDLRETESV